MISNQDEIFQANPNLIGTIFFSLDTKVSNHTRAIYNVLDLLGDVGGFYDVLKLIAWFLTTFFTYGSLNNNLI